MASIQDLAPFYQAQLLANLGAAFGARSAVPKNQRAAAFAQGVGNAVNAQQRFILQQLQAERNKRLDALAERKVGVAEKGLEVQRASADAALQRAMNAQAPKPTNLQKEAQFLYPDDPSAQRQFIQAYRNKPPMQVNTGNLVAAEEIKNRGARNRAVQEEIRGQNKGLQEAAAGTYKPDFRLDVIEDQLQRGVATGPDEKFFLGFKEMLVGFGLEDAVGLDPAKIAGQAAILQQTSSLVNDSLRLNTGIQTEGDAKRAITELLDLGDSAGAIMAKITGIRHVNDWSRRLAAHSETLRQDDGTFPPDYYKRMADWKKDNPLFTEEYSAKLEAAKQFGKKKAANEVDEETGLIGVERRPRASDATSNGMAKGGMDIVSQAHALHEKGSPQEAAELLNQNLQLFSNVPVDSEHGQYIKMMIETYIRGGQ